MDKQAKTDLEYKLDRAAPAFIVGYDTIEGIAHEQSRVNGWWEEERNDGEMIALMHSELSEGLEALRKGLADDKLVNRPGIEVELADTVIRIMDYGAARGLDVSGAIVEKLRLNLTRGYRHGGKRF